MFGSSKIIVAASVSALLVAGSASAATIVTNGSFKSGTGTGIISGTPFSNLGVGSSASWDIYTGTSVTGWTADVSGIEIQTSKTLPFNAYEGNNYVELDTTRNSGMEQLVTLGVGRYQLTFAYSPRVDQACSPQPCVTTNGITYGIGDSSDDIFSQLADGPTSSVPFGQWTVFTREFTITTAGTYTLFFDATGRSNSYGGLLDGVAISAIPLPAGGLLLLGALGGLATFRRRKAV